jgi:drug/metabolite transporter (DMT)-like permease
MVSLITRKQAARADIVILNAGTMLFTTATVTALLAALVVLGGYRVRLGQHVPLSVGLLLVSVLAAMAVGNTIYFLALRWIGVCKAMPLSQIEPLLATGMAVALLGERITLGLGLGVALIPIGVHLIACPSGADETLTPG